MNRPDLRWIQDQLDANGLKFDPYTSDDAGFQCQCPVHRGEGKSARFAVRNGTLLFHCYAHGCSFEAMKDALDLTDGDVYEERILLDRQREMRRKNAVTQTEPELTSFYFEETMQKRRLTESETRAYRETLKQLHGNAA